MTLYSSNSVCWSLWLAGLPESGWRVSHLRVSLLLPEKDPEPALMESEMLEDRCMSEDHCFTPLSRTKEHLFNLKPEKYWVGQKSSFFFFFPPVSWLLKPGKYWVGQKVHSFIFFFLFFSPGWLKLALVAFSCLLPSLETILLDCIVTAGISLCI